MVNPQLLAANSKGVNAAGQFESTLVIPQAVDDRNSNTTNVCAVDIGKISEVLKGAVDSDVEVSTILCEQEVQAFNASPEIKAQIDVIDLHFLSGTACLSAVAHLCVTVVRPISIAPLE